MPRLFRNSLAGALVAGLIGVSPTMLLAQGVPDQPYGGYDQDNNAPYGQEGYGNQGDRDDRYGQPGYDDGEQGRDGAGNPATDGYEQQRTPDQGYPPPQGRSYPETTDRDSYGAPPYDGEMPAVNVDRDGQGEVRVGGDCRVYYDDWGTRRTSATPRCTADQIGDAEDAMSRYRQAQGLDRYRPGYDGGYYQPPRAFVSGNGAGRVVVSDGCTAFYDRYGQRETATDGCTRQELWSADDTMARYRRERGGY
ncbi:hypothetical protein [Flavisphingomonas formosensis]|uniref:hypothetical protein n=1 Tax=Flavisphingomonas formosensis TaxID=861534 RepID=UPI0012FA168B|nr:hypothetical protein [Sphingomonas formosensis]